jgi:hypothetical protein
MRFKDIEEDVKLVSEGKNDLINWFWCRLAGNSAVVD